MTTLASSEIMQKIATIGGMSAEECSMVLANTILLKVNNNAEVIAFLAIAAQYGLNPFTKEIYAFPAKGGGIQPIVSIDGWLKIINSHPQFDGMEYKDHFDHNGNLIAITCRIYRKDRSRPTEMTEYMSECKRSTEPWQKWSNRMLRHKATIQAARYAFGFSGIIDPDEAERINELTPIKPNELEPPKLNENWCAPWLERIKNAQDAKDITEIVKDIKEEIEKEEVGEPEVSKVKNAIMAHSRDLGIVFDKENDEYIPEKELLAKLEDKLANVMTCEDINELYKLVRKFKRVLGVAAINQELMALVDRFNLTFDSETQTYVEV